MRAALPLLIAMLAGCTSSTPLTSASGNGAAATGALELLRLDRAAFKPGERLTLFGAGFDRTADRNRVVFTGGEAPAELATPESLVVRVPAEARSGTLHVTHASQASRELPYVTEAPEVATLSVPATSAGASLLIQGNHFSPVLSENKVSFNGTFVTPIAGGHDRLVVVVAGSTGPLTVQTGAGASSPIDFVVIPQLGGNFNP